MYAWSKSKYKTQNQINLLYISLKYRPILKTAIKYEYVLKIIAKSITQKNLNPYHVLDVEDLSLEWQPVHLAHTVHSVCHGLHLTHGHHLALHLTDLALLNLWDSGLIHSHYQGFQKPDLSILLTCLDLFLDRFDQKLFPWEQNYWHRPFVWLKQF